MLLVGQKELDQAVSSCKRAIQLNPKLPNAYHGLGQAYSAQGKLDEAVAAFREAIELAPQSAPSRVALGAVLQDQGKRDEAMRSYQKAIELAPHFAPARQYLTRLCDSWSWELAMAEEMSERDPAKAVQLAEQATQLEPHVPDHLVFLGVAKYRMEEWKEAVEILERADAMLKGRLAGCRLFLAMAYWRLGDKKAAQDLYADRDAWETELPDGNNGWRRALAEADQLMGEPGKVPLATDEGTERKDER